MRFELGYARAVVAAVPLSAVARAVARRARDGERAAYQADDEARRLAADALERAPRLFTAEPVAEAYRAWFADRAPSVRARADEILSHRIELFGRRYALGETIDWLRDPESGTRFDGVSEPRAVLAALFDGKRGDPKLAWELQRAAHLVELGAAARLFPELAGRVRDEVHAQLGGFLERVRPRRGLAYASPLEVAMRAIHWLAALELAGGARAFPRGFVERLGGALLEDLDWLWWHLEAQGLSPANHLLADLVGAFALAVALDGAPGARTLLPQIARALEREVARQVGPDGAHFEASTGYHRFALELILVAHRLARAAGVALEVAGPLARMFAYLRGIVQPDGSDPAFGDGDDARVVPAVARHPRALAYLLPIGVALFRDPALRAPGVELSEEALLLFGPEARRAWDEARVVADPRSIGFAHGGVHVLRGDDLYVALRAGPHGQDGVGGHAHNDQLSLVVHAGGRPLIVDAGTGCYTRDPLLRDRLRATGAHSTVIVDGQEQSPMFATRLFALPDRARGEVVRRTESEIEAVHRGYRRLGARVIHRRLISLHRAERVIVVEDRLEGRGEASIDLRFLFAAAEAAPPSAAMRARLQRLRPLLGPVDESRVVELDGRVALVPLGRPLADFRIEPGLYSPRFNQLAAATLVVAASRLRLTATVRHALVLSRKR